MDSSAGVVTNVQHVTKQSSDQLLSKFAELGSDSGGLKRRRKRPIDHCDTPFGGGGGGDRKWLIPAAGRKSVMLKKLGIGTSRSHHLRIRDFRNKSILGAIQKTWRRTVEGASKVLIEKHYNTHRRLISDIV